MLLNRVKELGPGGPIEQGPGGPNELDLREPIEDKMTDLDKQYTTHQEDSIVVQQNNDLAMLRSANVCTVVDGVCFVSVLRPFVVCFMPGLRLFVACFVPELRLFVTCLMPFQTAVS